MAVPETKVLAALRAAVGDEHVVDDHDVAAGALTDWTGRWSGDAAVVRPGAVDEVATVLRLCGVAGVSVVPQGGNTGLVGGSVPDPASSRPTIVLSTSRLNDLDPVDVAGRSIGAGAGATLAAVHAAAADAGLGFGVDLAARDSATVGGMVATNAGGIRMIRHGDMRSQLLGVEAVLSSGEVIRRWRPLRKDNVGYHLPGLFAGSEGTLAVITRVLLRLVDPPQQTSVAIAAVADVPATQVLLDRVRRSGLTLEAAEVMTRSGIEAVRAEGVRPPFAAGDAAAAPAFLLVETASTDDDLAAVLADVGDTVIDAVVEPGPAPSLWAVRERHTEAVGRQSSTPPVKLDVSAPADQIPALIAWVEDYAASIGARAVQFGHLADGNIHVNLLDVAAGDTGAATDAVLRRVAEIGGSISAEHGIGRAKSAHLGLGRDAADVAAMRAVKAALDPAGILNPEAVFG